MKAFLAILRRDLHLAFRQGMDSVMVVAFFVLAVVLFPFGVGPEPNLLARIGAGVVWVAALLASLLALERLFQSDYEDGSLELLVLSPVPVEIAVLAKIAAHWLTTGLPVIAAAPLLALFMHVGVEGCGALVATLLIGTPTLSLIGAVGSALTLGARRGGVLLSLLILPLYVPTLVFGVGAVEAVISGFPASANILMLSALAAAALALCPLAAAAAVRQALE